MATIFLKAARWRLLLGSSTPRASYWLLFMNIVTGQLLNNLYPGRVGDLSRAYIVGKRGVGGAYVLGTIVIEKIFDMLLYTGLFLTSLVLIRLPDWIAGSGYTLAVITTAAILGMWLLAFRLDLITGFLERIVQKFPVRWTRSILDNLRPGLTSLKVMQKGSHILLVLGVTFLIWISAILTNTFTLLAINLHLPFLASVLVLVLLQVGITLPSIPGNVGIFEYLCILALSFFLVDSPSALSFGILLHAVVLLPLIVLGLIFIWIIGTVKGPKTSLSE
jgi:uncharacterized protein (TIRG00374 family)